METKNIKIFALSFLAILGLIILVAPKFTFAHEAYVLTPEQFHAGLQVTGFNEISALKNPSNVRVTLIISFGILIALILNTLFWRSHAGHWLSPQLEKFKTVGSTAVRIAIAISLFYSALSWSFLGPELHLTDLPAAGLMRFLMFVISLMIFVGLWTELAAAVGIILFGIGFMYFGTYLATYLNYLGELIVLLLFGLREFSFDKILHGPLKRFLNFEKYHVTIVRTFYGAALAYAAINVKFIHPILTETVVQTYQLTRFHWLFPHDPLLITLGAALSELAIGLFIFLGFQTRFTVLVSVFYITLSLLFFREAVWPHLLLYGISISLLANGPGPLAIDNWLFNYKLKRASK